MIMERTARTLLCLLLSLAVPVVALSDSPEERLAALEARVEQLEAQLAVLLEELPAEPEPPQVGEYAIGDTASLNSGLSVTFDRYEIGGGFRYYPSGGISSLTLKARSGYSLLCLFITVRNDSSQNISAASLANAQLSYGGDFTIQARETFYYLTNHGVYAEGLQRISPGTTVQGCLVFGLPQEAETSRQQIVVDLTYQGAQIRCELRPTGSLLDLEVEQEIQSP